MLAVSQSGQVVELEPAPLGLDAPVRYKLMLQATSYKVQATSHKLQATS